MYSKISSAAADWGSTLNKFVDPKCNPLSPDNLLVMATGPLTGAGAPTGPAKGLVCHLQEMLEEYYQVQGWTEDGVPGEEILNRLGLA